MRPIKYIVVHCTATHQDAKIQSIIDHWQKVLGWKTPGYHFIIDKNGNTTKLLGIDKPSNGVKGHNQNSIHIAYIGGITAQGNPIDNRTAKQEASLLYNLQQLKHQFPNAIIQGHRDFAGVKKACPCFDAKKEYEDIFDIFA